MSERERLTVFKDGFWEHKDFPDLKDKDSIDKFVDCVKELVERLAQYEDAEEQGLLLRPPCKVGDTVYYLNKRPHIALYQDTIYEAEVVRIVTTRLGTSLVIQIHNDYGCCEIPDIKDFGKTVFLTREEAEAALKERDKE